MESPPLRPTKRALPENTVMHTGARGTTYITKLAPGCILITTTGYDDGQTAPHYFAALDLETAKTGFINVFIDSRAQTGVSSEARDACANWVKRNMSSIRGNHLLFRSKLLEMAVAIVNLATRGPTKAHSNVARFEALIREVVPTFKHLPTFEP